MAQNLRLAVRRLLASPGFAPVAIGTLALGIGANAAMFSVVRAVLLAPLPYTRRTSSCGSSASTPTRAGARQPLARRLPRLRPRHPHLPRMGAHGFVGSATISGPEATPNGSGMVRVTAGFFPTLGVQPALGRLFTADEDRPGAPRVALISDGYWRRRFAADPGLVGREIRVNAEPFTVVGVLPAGYRHLEEDPDRSADVFLPFAFDPATANRGGHFIRAVGRLAPGASLEQARAEFTTIAARLEQEFPTSNHGEAGRPRRCTSR